MVWAVRRPVAAQVRRVWAARLDKRERPTPEPAARLLGPVVQRRARRGLVAQLVMVAQAVLVAQLVMVARAALLPVQAAAAQVVRLRALVAVAPAARRRATAA